MVHRKQPAEKVPPKAPAKPLTAAARIRQWAAETGVPGVPERGRIPDWLLELYSADDRNAAVTEARAKRAQADVEAENNPIMRPTGKRHRANCGFCSAALGAKPHCERCPGTIRNADPSNRDRVWVCPCFEKDPERHVKAKDYRSLT